MTRPSWQGSSVPRSPVRWLTTENVTEGALSILEVARLERVKHTTIRSLIELVLGPYVHAMLTRFSERMKIDHARV